MKGWGQLYHRTAHELMDELERLAPHSAVLLNARRTFEIGDTLGVRASGRPTVEARQRKRQAIIERIAERDLLDEEAARLYATGLSLLQTGKALGGKTGQWVRASLARQGIPCRPRGPGVKMDDMPRLDRIRRWREAGKSLEEIGAALGISRERVRQISIRNGIDTKRSEELNAEQKRAVAEYVAGSSLNEVAERHGCTTGTLRNWILRGGFLPRSKGRSHSLEVRQRAARIGALYQQGHSLQHIAAEVGLSKPEMIYRYLAIAGVHPNRNFGGSAAGMAARQ